MEQENQGYFFVLETFEQATYRREYESAAQMLMQLLHHLDANYGVLDFAACLSHPANLPPDELELHVMSRITAAISALFSDPQFTLSPQGYGQLLNWQRWLATIFCASPMGNADHVLRTLNLMGPTSAELQLKNEDLQKFSLLYFPDSSIPVDVDALWAHNPKLTAGLCLVLLSPRFLGSPSAHGKRETLLQWLPEKLKTLDQLDDLPVGILHDVYMHCSYADIPGRHAIKGALNVLIRQTLAREWVKDIPEAHLLRAAERKEGKPVLLIVLEWFSGGHSIYRTHSRTMLAAREKFHTVAIGYPNCVDEIGKEVFDEFIELDANLSLVNQIRQIRDIAEKTEPLVLYMPSVGMFALTMFMANVRLAPLQVAALGHPATTHSDKIDRISVEDDFVGDPACFSEQLMRLPKDGQPYIASRSLPEGLTPTLPPPRETLRIAVAATTMKINPRFLGALRSITEKSAIPVEFHFLMGLGAGMVYSQAKRLVRAWLPNAVVHAQQPYPQYLDSLNNADLFISPFPFGNTNGIVDAFHVGLPGVNLSGAEVFEHIDEALFRRAGMPEWTTTRSVEEYVDAVVRLANNREEREALRRRMIEEKSVERLFEGRAAAFGECLVEELAVILGERSPFAR
ncbi:MAG: peptide transporter [Betaproteobacteria bacterium]|nr:peptide transporter [Betaproteobacteria bacterium]